MDSIKNSVPHLGVMLVSIFIFGFTLTVPDTISPQRKFVRDPNDSLTAVANASSAPTQGWKSTVKEPPKQGWKSTVKEPPKQAWDKTPVQLPAKDAAKSTPSAPGKRTPTTAAPTGSGSGAKERAAASGGAAGSSGGRERVGASLSRRAGGEIDRAHYTKKVQESDQRIQALQKRIRESRQREKDLNAEYEKTNQGIIRDSAMGAVGEEAGSRGSITQRTHERGKAALDGPGIAMTRARDIWSKNVAAERQTRQGLERDLKAAQAEKEGYQRKVKESR